MHAIIVMDRLDRPTNLWYVPLITFNEVSVHPPMMYCGLNWSYKVEDLACLSYLMVDTETDWHASNITLFRSQWAWSLTERILLELSMEMCLCVFLTAGVSELGWSVFLIQKQSRRVWKGDLFLPLHSRLDSQNGQGRQRNHSYKTRESKTLNCAYLRSAPFPLFFFFLSMEFDQQRVTRWGVN